MTKREREINDRIEQHMPDWEIADREEKYEEKLDEAYRLIKRAHSLIAHKTPRTLSSEGFKRIRAKLELTRRRIDEFLAGE